MRLPVLTLLVCVVATLLLAEVGEFNTLERGYIAGKMAVYASGDTIMYAARNSTLQIVLYRSTNQGVDWVANNSIFNVFFGSNVTPTLSVNNQDCIITAGKYYSVSQDGGVTWQEPETWDGSFDSSPYMEKNGTDINLFNIIMPYPENSQSDFVIPGTNEFAAPQMFMNTHESMNETRVTFTGNDTFNGPVRINGDIHIQAGSMTDPEALPRFLAPVVVSGVVDCPDTYPMGQIFQGGLLTKAPRLELPNASLVRQNAQLVGASDYNPDHIVMVTVSGNTYTALLGIIQPPRVASLNVWSDYPNHPFVIDSPSTYTNVFSVRDTLWTALPSGTTDYGTFFVNSKLWIRGQFSGHQTWCAADTVMIIGDITLTNTTPGLSPYPDNMVDSVNLVSEKSILLKYGYRDPITSHRVHPLCRDAQHPIHIYASLYALGDGNGDSRSDGMFTFEYQHPHGSIEPQEIILSNGETVYLDMIDLHRNRFPQSADAPWPPNLDYPWYNPLYPEQAPYLERGKLNIWGSIVQRRFGYMRRSHYDNEHPSNGIWNPQIDYCGSSSEPYSNTQTIALTPTTVVQLTTRNYPGTSGQGIGYRKSHSADLRNTLSHASNNGDNGLWGFGLMLDSKHATSPNTDFEHRFFKPQFKLTNGKSFTRKGNNALYSVNDILISEAGGVINDLSDATLSDGTIVSTAIKNGNEPVVYQLLENSEEQNMVLKYLSSTDGTVQEQSLIPVSTKMNDIVVLGNNRAIMAKYELSGQITLWDLHQNLQPTLLETVVLPEPITLTPRDRLYLVASGDNSVDLFVTSHLPPLPSGNPSPSVISHVRASFPVINTDPIAPSVLESSLSVYPNPMHSDLSLSVKLSGNHPHQVDIFNLRGQKVKSLSGATKNTDGGFSYHWDGTDEHGRVSASGIYLVKLSVDNKRVLIKKICRY